MTIDRPFSNFPFKPTPQEVKDFHDNSDKDANPDALHHTLGSKPYQAAPGDHDHLKTKPLYQSSPLNANITGAVDMFRDGRTVEVSFNVGSAFAMPGGTVFTVFPNGWVPSLVSVGNRYQAGLRGSSGAYEPYFFDNLGRLVNVFAIPAGDSMYGSFTFVIYNG